jgi:putative tricarboxylic transport membrane protein
MGSRHFGEVAAGLCLAASGAVITTLARRMGAGPDPSAPGPGVAPSALGIGLVLLGLVIALTAALRAPAPAPAGGLSTEEPGGTRKLVIAALLLAGCVILFEPAGFMLATFVFLLLGFTLLGEASWRTAAPAAAIAAGGLWLFFTKLLGVGLPYGLIGEILFR